jgi:hypothetical protein
MGGLLQLPQNVLISSEQHRNPFQFRALFRQLDEQGRLADHGRIHELSGQLVMSVDGRFPFFQ